MNKDMCVVCDDGILNIRAGAIIRKDGKLLLIRWLFRNGYAEIVLDTNLTNTRAQHVYESLGFRKVRTNIDSWKDQLGRLQSSVDYALVEPDFVSYE